ncbi:MBL fold metallo-hydrolase [bacterium]|nr:MBL fold metallo-hydrolase [bacterium]
MALISLSRHFAVLLIIVSTFTMKTYGQSERTATKLADGIYEIEHGGQGGGNTTVIIGERQVFVVDAGFLPSAASEDITQIRKWTDKPVSFLLNTHFHNDHNFGNRVYMNAFPALTIIAHTETKKDMDRFGPGSAARIEKYVQRLKQMLDSGKTSDGTSLTADDIKEVKNEWTRSNNELNELKSIKFQSATLMFQHDFTIDLGNREVQVKFLGRGNTAGDAVVYLPKEKIVVTGDLVVYPIPFMYDGYPNEWIETLENLIQLDAGTIVPGHGPIMHDKEFIRLIRDIQKSAVDQMNDKLSQSLPAMFQTLDKVKDSIDLSSFRQRFTRGDKELDASFDEMVNRLIKIVFHEASLR